MVITSITDVFMSTATPFELFYLGFVKLGYYGSPIAHLPGCFCPWTFFLEYWIEYVTTGLPSMSVLMCCIARAMHRVFMNYWTKLVYLGWK